MQVRRLLFIGACAVAISSSVYAQQKKPIPYGPPPQNKYISEKVIDVPDAPGHQVRVFELLHVSQKDGMIIDGVQVKEWTTYGTSDYTNWTGHFTQYNIYTMEDGSKVFARGGGTSQSDANGRRAYSYVDHIIGGTGRFKGIRGEIFGRGERPTGANSVMDSESHGEYWFDQ